MGRTKFKFKKKARFRVSNKIGFFENNIIRDFDENSNKNGIKRIVKSKISNKYLYFTPISKTKKTSYIPSTPIKEKKYNELIKDDVEKIKGKNLLYIFETM